MDCRFFQNGRLNFLFSFRRANKKECYELQEEKRRRLLQHTTIPMQWIGRLLSGVAGDGFFIAALDGANKSTLQSSKESHQ